MFIIHIILFFVGVCLYFGYIKPKMDKKKKSLIEKNELVYVSDTLNGDDWCLRVYQGLDKNGLIKCKYSPERDVFSYWKYCIKFDDYKIKTDELPNKKVIINMNGKLIYLYR